MSEVARQSTIYSQEDLDAINRQIRQRWLAVILPCAALLAGVVVSLIFRVEAVTTICTILIGVLLIFCYDLLIKPLCCYRKLLKNVLYGRVHEAKLPFVALSEDVNMVDGVACHQLICEDFDAKGRPYERLFYFDAEKTCPEFQAGDRLHIVHHDLLVADVTRA